MGVSVTTRHVGIAIIVVGAIVFLVSLTADLTGLTGDDGFEVGPRQWAGILLGVLIMIPGVFLVLRKPSE